MRQETELVPYTTTRLTGSPLLVLAPHPDDEIFGCGGVLLHAVQSKAEIHVAVVTDGAAQGEARARCMESTEAARRLGTPPPEFWGFADRSLESDTPELLDRIRDSLVNIKPALVLVPSPAELHPDHRALGLATYRVLHGIRREALHPEFRLAAYEVSAFLRPNTLIDLSEDWALINHASESFSSQNVVRPYLEVLEAMAVARRLTLPDSVTYAAGLYVVDSAFIGTHNVRDWAECIGPTTGIEADDPAAARDQGDIGFFRRLMGSRRSSTHG